MTSDLVVVEGVERLDHRRVELQPGEASHLANRVWHGPRRLVRPFMGERVEDIGDRDDAAAERYLVACESVRIAGSVPPFVVGPGDLLGELQERRGASGENSGAG